MFYHLICIISVLNPQNSMTISFKVFFDALGNGFSIFYKKYWKAHDQADKRAKNPK